jgi:hypothetical protein
MQRELDARDARVKADRKRVRKLNRRLAEQNRKIAVRNGRDGSSIPPQPLLPEPDDVVFDLDVKQTIRDLKADGVTPIDFSYRAIVDRIRVLTLKHPAGEVDLTGYYSLAYRGLSLTGVHPTANVLGRYIRSGGFLTIRPQPPPSEDEGLVHLATVNTLIVAERVLEFFEIDPSWFSQRLVAAFAAAREAARGHGVVTDA